MIRFSTRHLQKCSVFTALKKLCAKPTILFTLF